MSSEIHRRAKEIVPEAAEMAPAGRARFLARACGDDEALRREVESLLLFADTRHDAFADDAIAGDRAAWAAAALGSSAGFQLADEEIQLPQRVGPYRVIRLIGAGGMGVVYEAQQDHPRRTIAVKVMRPGLISPRLVRRFEYEAELLARLQHPGIAHVYEAGTADVVGSAGVKTNEPYFAMELVRGESITQYATRRKLDIESRLHLIVMVCDAVEHAHRMGVIHRDLKPANILVNETGEPKVLDFGVARLTDADVTIATLQTGPEKLVGTIAYMSPEQLCGEDDRIDTRCDVYALGVVAYELLTGMWPFDLANKSLPQVIRTISDQEPRSPGAVRPELRGDLDAVLSQAIAKDPARRYSTACEFAADLRRYLQREPVTARPVSTLYILKCFAQRNRGLVATAALAIVALLLGIAGTTTFAWRESKQAAAAIAQAERAQAITRFLRDMLSSVDPSTALGENVTVLQVLDDAAKNIDETVAQMPPEVEAALRFAIGDAYLNLGRYNQAAPQLEKSLDTRRVLHATPHPDLGDSVRSLGLAYGGLGDYSRAEALGREAISLLEKMLGSENAEMSGLLCDLASSVSELGRLEEAENLLLRAIELRRKFAQDKPLLLAESLNSLGTTMMRRGRMNEAEPLIRESLEIRRRMLPADHPRLTYSLNNLGKLLHIKEDLDGAEALLTEALEARRRTLEPTHPDLAISLGNLALLIKDRGRHAEAVAMLRDAADIQRQSLGEYHSDLGKTYANLSSVLSASGDYEGAEHSSLKALDINRKALGDRHPSVGLVMTNLAISLMRKGDAGGAETMLRDALDILDASLGRSHRSTAHCRHTLGALLNSLDRHGEAIPLVEEALQHRRDALGENHAQVGLSLSELAEAQFNVGDASAAAQAAQRAIEILTAADGMASDQAAAMLILAQAAGAQGNTEMDVESLIKDVVEIRQSKLGDTAWQIADAQRVYANWLMGQGRFDEAESLLTAALGIPTDDMNALNLDQTQFRRRAQAALGELHRRRGIEQQ